MVEVFVVFLQVATGEPWRVLGGLGMYVLIESSDI
jgi:hypothetical protein